MTVGAETSPRPAPAAIVTGASSGIGEATALLLARRGFAVGVTYSRNEKGARRVAREIEELGQRASVVHLDLTSPAEADIAIDGMVAELGRVDALVNNAGVNPRNDVLDESVAGWEETLRVNLVGPWACARAVVKHMLEAGRGGRIVNISSVLASAPIEGGAAYCASKAGLDLLTKVMALEWARHGITVNAVAPGHTATPMNFEPAQLDGTIIERPVIPSARAANPEEIAAVIAFLVAPDASYVTGSSVLVDGGLLLASGPQSLQDATGLPPSNDPR